MSVPRTVHWIRPDRETVVIVDQRSIDEVDLDVDDAYAIDWTIALDPAVDVLLDLDAVHDLGWLRGARLLRGRPDWTDTRLLLADGSVHDRAPGVRSEWCDLSGSVDGTTACVVGLHCAANVRHPVPWYGSTKSATYGDEGWSNFVNAAFLWDEPLRVAAGDVLR